MTRNRVLLIAAILLMVSASAMAADKPSFDLKWYGYFKLDGAFDQNPTSHGNFIMWIPQQALDESDRQFNMTANETRFGFSAAGKGYDNVKVNGKLEFDLFASISGTTIAENKPMLQLRHAFFSLESGRWKLIAGQTWDMISPLNPSTLNYSVLWGSGNIGYRRPQMSLWYTSKPNTQNEITLGGGIFRTIGGDLTPTFSLATSETADGPDDGADAAIPSVQGIVDFKHVMQSGGTLRMGISGLYGDLKAETNQGRSQKYSTWTVAGHLQMSPSPKFGFATEVFTGSNLGSYLGSILLNSQSDGLQTNGGWVSTWWQASPKTQFSVGYGVDNPNDDDLSSGRSRNACLYGNVRYTIVPQATLGLELSDWSTKYAGAETSSNVRMQTSFILNF